MGIGWLLLVTLGAASADQSALRYGPWRYYSFKPTATLATKEESVTVRLFLPSVQKTPTQQVIRLSRTPIDPLAKEIFDKARLNSLFRYELDLNAGRPKTIGFDAIVAVRSVQLDRSAADAAKDNPLSSEERRRL